MLGADLDSAPANQLWEKEVELKAMDAPAGVGSDARSLCHRV